MISSTIRIAFRARPPHFLRLVPVGRNRKISHSIASQYPTNTLTSSRARDDTALVETEKVKPGHAVISTFDLFSIGVGPSSSHTVGPMRAGKIFIADLQELQVLEKVPDSRGLHDSYGSLAATGKYLDFRVLHHTPQAVLLGLEGSDPETIDTGTISSRYEAILANRTLHLGGIRRITFDMDRDMLWRWDQVLKTHPNGMRFSCFGEEGELLATNEYYSVGGGFVVNEKTKIDENLFYKGVDKSAVHGARLHQTHNAIEGDQTPAQPAANDPGHPPYPFESGNSLLALTRKHNLTIAQIVHDNERYFGLSEADINDKLMRIWAVMDDCIRSGVSTAEKTLPGRLGLRRRAPMLYKRLMRGFYPGIATPDLQLIGSASTPPVAAIDAPESDIQSSPYADGSDGRGGVRASGKNTHAPWVTGSFDHAILPMPPRKTMIPAVDFLSCYAIAVNEVNASGGRIVTSPTNGAAGVIPAVLKYVIEFISDDPEKSIKTFLLTAAAVGMLFKRGSTISAAEGGCQAEVGVACSMASAGFAACMGASPETVLQAAEIGIEHNLGLTCDPIDGLVQVPCIERNSLGAVKAVTAAQLSMASTGVYRVTLDEAIEAMRLTAADMSVKYKETSLSTTVKIPLTVPAC
ncbi:serine dehydratase alpha chain-domain-containing protein [Suillus plorans]|uniref:Serine dehydratase alpha chain-domain-containing protein n=1 Tax=Suillus plorans TaxID=116603 RepID=A0A9P7AL84_9AGAM|nr:serine dehydratase alpha chain-domain-containing protein [Suillus plorans]KAG1791690.1 serine dehydratase alpha chain-domain-containing protein [Suillus plorans]